MGNNGIHLLAIEMIRQAEKDYTAMLTLPEKEKRLQELEALYGAKDRKVSRLRRTLNAVRAAGEDAERWLKDDAKSGPFLSLIGIEDGNDIIRRLQKNNS